MRPLTDKIPKPLAPAGGGRRLLDWQIDALVKAGVRDIVLNIAHLSGLFVPALGHERLGARLTYSVEGACYEESLETKGGIVKALPLLTDGEEPFIVCAGDIVTDFDYRRLLSRRGEILSGAAAAHLVLVPNPPFHQEGDMGLLSDGRVARNPKSYTFSGIGIYSPKIFTKERAAFEKLFPWLYGFADAGLVTGEVWTGLWKNVGTVSELEALQASADS